MNYTKEMICKYCDKKMELNDVDYRSRGNKDNYWACDNCNAGAIEFIRYGKRIKVDFYRDDDNERRK